MLLCACQLLAIRRVTVGSAVDSPCIAANLDCFATEGERQLSSAPLLLPPLTRLLFYSDRAMLVCFASEYVAKK
jgi:hypothetical protein